MSEILMMEAANIFIGDHDPEKSKHLQITNLTLPTLEYKTVDHLAGGAVMEVAWNMGVLAKLEPGFKLVGFDEEAYRAAGVGSNRVEIFTAYGALRRKTTGKMIAAKAVFRGSLGKAAPDQFDRSNNLGHDHTIVDVTRYRLEVGGREWFDVDFWSSKRRRFGIDEYAETRRALGLS
jgi:P2 family phage contractile tail tube protein